MARCQATTKSGTRCKLNAPEGADLCSIHRKARAASAESAPVNGDEVPDADKPQKRFRSKHINSSQDLMHLAIGAAATVAMLWLLKRVPRPPGL